MVSAGGALKVGELFAALGLDDSEYNRGLDKAEARGKGFGVGLAGASTIAATAIAAVGASAAVGLGMAVKSAANYEFAISAVGAVAGATDEELKGLGETGLRIGKETAFSATEAASAMEILAANGVSVRDIMNGAADAAVALAAAGGTDLRTAADLASTSMTVWGLSTEQMTDVVNRLAGAANVSRFGVEDMAMAVAQGGGAAALAGVEFGDFASAIAAIAPSFASGSDAGTSFKAFLNGLTPSTAAARGAMRDLGIITEDGTNSFFTAEGQLRSMVDVVDILNKATAGLNEEQKSQALTTIFGTDAMRAAGSLSRLTRDEFAALDSTMANSDAAEIAKKRMDNLSGAMEELKGSLETVAIEIGTVFLPILTRLAGWLADEIPRAFDRAKEAFAWMGDNFPIVAGAAVLLGGALTAVLLPSIAGLVGPLLVLMKTLLPLALKGSLIGALVAGAVLLVTNWDKIREKAPGLAGAIDGVTGDLRKLAGLFSTGMDGGSIVGEFSDIERAAFNAGGKFGEFVNKAGEVAHFFQVGLSGGKIVGEFSDLERGAFNVGSAVREGAIVALERLGEALEVVGGFLSSTVLPALGTVASFVAGAFVGAFQAVVGFVTSTVIPGFQAFTSLISGWLLPLLDQAREKFNNDVRPALETVAEGFELAARVILMVLKPALDGLLLALGAVVAVVTNVFGVIVRVIKDNSDEFVAVLAAAWHTIWSLISLALELIRDTVSVALALLRGDWQGAWDGLVTLGKNALDNFLGVIEGALDLIKSAFKLAFGIVESTVKEIIERLVAWVFGRLKAIGGGIKDAIRDIPFARKLGLVGDDVAPAPQGPSTDVPAMIAGAVRGPMVDGLPSSGMNPIGTPWVGAPVQVPSNNVTIERMDVGVRPDIPGGVDPAPIRAALEEIDFSRWDVNADLEAGR